MAFTSDLLPVLTPAGVAGFSVESSELVASGEAEEGAAPCAESWAPPELALEDGVVAGLAFEGGVIGALCVPLCATAGIVRQKVSNQAVRIEPAPDFMGNSIPERALTPRSP